MPSIAFDETFGTAAQTDRDPASRDPFSARSGAAFARSQRTERHPSGEGRGTGIALAGQVLNFAEGREIYGEGQPVRFFYKVMSGMVRTCRFTSDGRRQIDGFHAEGEIFGLETGGEHRLSAEAVNDCCVVAYRWAGLEAFDGGEADTARTVFGFAVTCLKRAQEHALLLGRRSAAQKLATFLLDLASRGCGGPDSPDSSVDLAMTRQDIADYLGLTIETVSRTLSQFERDRLIALPSIRHVVLRNRAALQDLVD
ncbi:helix-turn-helix domain-containing protein [Aurantimonas sp. 22II-16-19i]|uniref:helix-turn-helix domain-containing protein n=1 Tax=Aurantimonas sp. 22II-16-19i TaxID=1317114 RepID=UPI0009F7A71C|nr:helix-turn-helix domain-containing protein [Aurantimonas sp. 22II-16-19i]ORE93950.1 Crp/Fnr family transcriptional regulator [Aurantimonas sp. 22II-16-19i]